MRGSVCFEAGFKEGARKTKERPFTAERLGSNFPPIQAKNENNNDINNDNNN